MYKSIEVISTLYNGSLLENYIINFRKDVFSNLTDTITLFAALAAIALPLAQQTFQWASDKYRSEHLIGYIESTSPIHPKKLNILLILYVVFILIFKVLSPLLNDFLFILCIIPLILFFSFNVFLLIKYLSHGYDMGKGLISIRNKILSNHIDLNNKYYSVVEISMLADYESYMLENDPLYSDFSKEFTDIRHALLKNINVLDDSILISYVQGVRKSLSFVPSTSSDIKYLRIAHSYVFFVQALICQDSKYFHLLNEVVETANSIERNRHGNEKPLLHGLVFHHINFRDWPKGLDDHLIRHFEHLTRTCVDTGDIQQLVHLYKEFNECLGYREQDLQVIKGVFFNQLKSYQYDSRVDKLVDLFIEDGDKVSLIREISKLIDGTEEDKKELFKLFFYDYRSYQLQKKAQAAFDYFLAEVAKNDIQVVLAIAEVRNPIGSGINMIGYDLIPTSLEDIVFRLSKRGQRFEERIFRDEMYNQHILKGYAIFLLYEICKLVKDNSNSFSFGYLNKYTFQDLKRLKDTISDIEKMKNHLINSQFFMDLYTLHTIDVNDVDKKTSNFIEALMDAIVNKIEDLSTNGKLSQEVIDRFYNSIPDVRAITEQNKCLFLGKVKLSRYGRIKRVIHIDRTSFLPETGVHTEFNRLGHSIIEEHLNDIYQGIYINTLGFDINNAWPINHGRLILLSFSQRIESEKKGFKFVKDKVYWPDGTSCQYKQINNIDIDKVVSILPYEAVVQVPDMVSPMYEASYIDSGKRIEWEIMMNIMPYGFRY